MDITKFSFKQKVKITNGFYKGYKGIIQSYTRPKTSQSDVKYEIKIESENKTVTIEEEHLRGLKLGFF